MESNILLESGTNELEVLEFMVGEQSFGINIAKVTEIMNYQPMVPVPDSHPAFEGVFTPRETLQYFCVTKPTLRIISLSLKNSAFRFPPTAETIFQQMR